MSRLKKFSHQIRTANVQDINRVLQEIQLRLDSLEGVGQDKDMLGQRIIRVGDPTQDRDAINMRYLSGELEDSELEGLFGVGISADAGHDASKSLSFGAVSRTHGAEIEPRFNPVPAWSADKAPRFTKNPTGNDIAFNGHDRINWRKITADSVTLSAGTSANTVADLRTANDGNVYNVVEAAATPAMTLRVDFEEVKAFNLVCVLATYEGTATHALEIELYNWATAGWDHFQSLQDSESNSGTIFNNEDFFVPDDTDYIGTGADIGNVRVRFNHPMAGNASHNLYIDVVALYQ